MRKDEVKVWDNDGVTMDRYSVAIKNSDGAWDTFTMSDDPNAPNGVNQYGGVCLEAQEARGLGVRIVPFDKLPKAVRTAIIWRGMNK